jgi:hypothetical protein
MKKLWLVCAVCTALLGACGDGGNSGVASGGGGEASGGTNGGASGVSGAASDAFVNQARAVAESGNDEMEPIAVDSIALTAPDDKEAQAVN